MWRRRPQAQAHGYGASEAQVKATDTCPAGGTATKVDSHRNVTHDNPTARPGSATGTPGVGRCPKYSVLMVRGIAAPDRGLFLPSPRSQVGQADLCCDERHRDMLNERVC